MIVTVEWFGQMRDAAGTATETVEADSSVTVAELLRGATESRPVLATMIFGSTPADTTDGSTATDRVTPTLVISVDGRQVANSQTHLVHDGATLLVMSPISGG